MNLFQSSLASPEREVSKSGPSLQSSLGMSPSTSSYAFEDQVDKPFVEEAVGFTLGLVPFAKLAVNWEGEMDRFKELEESEQRDVILWEAAGIALGLAPIPIAKGAKAVKNIWKSSTAPLVERIAARRLSRYATPVEDVTNWMIRDRNYLKEVRLKAGQGGLGLSPSETDAVESYFSGKTRALAEKLKSKADPPTEQFKNLVQTKGRYAGQLKKEAREAFDPIELRNQQLRREYTEQIYGRAGVTKGAEQVEQQFGQAALHEVAFQKIAEKLYGKEAAASMKLIDAAPEELVAIGNFVKGHEAPRLVHSLAYPGALSWFRRVPSVMGKGEKAYGTKSKMYDPTEKADELSRLGGLKNSQQLHEVLEQRGFVELTKNGYKTTKRYTKSVAQKTLLIFNEIAALEQDATRLGIRDFTEEVQGELTRRLALSNTPEDLAVSELTDALLDFSAQLYKEKASFRAFEALNRKYLKPSATRDIERIAQTLERNLDGLFKTTDPKNVIARTQGLKKALSDIQLLLDKEFTLLYDTEGWTEQVLLKEKGRLINNFRLGAEAAPDLAKADGLTYFPAYRVNFVQPATTWKGRPMNIITKGGRAATGQGGREEFYSTMERSVLRPSATLEDEVVKRISQHNQFIHFRPAVVKAAREIQNLPPKWKTYFEHYVSRKLGLPSKADDWVARTITSVVGPLAEATGRSGLFTAHDVMRLSKTINDWTYTGFLGLKPFSAMRNYIQVPMMVPADLGGWKDIYTVGRAYKAVLTGRHKNLDLIQPTLVKELESMGVIPEEFTGEFAQKAFNVLRERRDILGMRLPASKDLQEGAMWMFSKSHSHNCYVSGASALIKWQDAIDKIGGKAFLDRRMGEFIKRSGLKGRDPAIRAEIERQIADGDLYEARKLFVQSVVEDTQFVYGSGSSPLITQSLGGAGKTIAIFQTFWMNYADTLAKWSTTGDMDMKAARLMNFMLSGAMSYTLMRTIWDHQTSASTIFAGPFESVNALTAEGPPAWRATSEMLRTLTTVGGLAETEDPYSEAVQKRVTALLKSGVDFLPAGMQLRQSASTFFEKDEFLQLRSEKKAEDFFKSIFRIAERDKRLFF